MNAAYLYAQLEQAEKINKNRLASWELYYKELKLLADREIIELPYIPDECSHNAHMFYIKTKDKIERDSLIEYLKQNDIQSVFHYVPLHSSPAGKKYGCFHGEDVYTTLESDKLIRLPMYYRLEEKNILETIYYIKSFYKL